MKSLAIRRVRREVKRAGSAAAAREIVDGVSLRSDLKQELAAVPSVDDAHEELYWEAHVAARKEAEVYGS